MPGARNRASSPWAAETTRGGRCVQGRGCLTIGIAGFVQVGGFGSFSKNYGTAAANLLAAEIVTANGNVRIAKTCTNPDLFWALKGGGGGSFGLVTRLTLRTRELPEYFGVLFTTIRAASDAAFRRLIAQFMERRRAAATPSPILYEQPDWRDFISHASLPRKAGCEPDQLGRVVLKELVDNALDSGASDVTLTGDTTWCAVADDGPGIESNEVPRLFAVNRPRISSKLKRLPTRGMLGKGLRVVMGAVAALGATISVTTRGQRYELGTNTVTGETEILSAADVPEIPGVMVKVESPNPLFTDRDFSFARKAIRIALVRTIYDGPSMPNWYGKAGLEMVLAAAPKDLTRDEVLLNIFGTTAPTDVSVDIGELGGSEFVGYYRKVSGTATTEDATIPFTVEVWVDCEPVENGDNTTFLPVHQ
jgi:hypothetical protein